MLEENQIEQSVKNLKLILGIKIDDTSKDDLIKLYFSRASNFVIRYCGHENFNQDMIEIAEDIAIIFYRNKGVENIESESKGRIVDTFRKSLSPEMYKRLNSNRRYRGVKQR
ncbi:phage head-tail connector protein [Metabacillus sp. 22489]|uniref:phage head-tail connector protein n=1 Tax=Metabacillus sp. 22489 TaxID=3453928 RepID=UPI003F83E360